jgi:hypothetical protein
LNGVKSVSLGISLTYLAATNYTFGLVLFFHGISEHALVLEKEVIGARFVLVIDPILPNLIRTDEKSVLLDLTGAIRISSLAADWQGNYRHPFGTSSDQRL